MKFKIFYNDEVRRFTLEKTPNWNEFWEFLTKEIFSKDSNFHKELFLQFTQNEELKTIKTSKEYDEIIKLYSQNELIKIRIIEGSGFYFKDAIYEPQVIQTYQKKEKIAGYYETFISRIEKDNENTLWRPWTPLLITNTHSTIIFDSKKIKNPIFTQNSLQWHENHDQQPINNIIDDNNNDDRNTTSAKLDFDENGTSFDGFFYTRDDDDDHHHDNVQQKEKIKIKGIKTKELNNEEDDKLINNREYIAKISNRVPKILESFFPNAKILPNHIPDWIKPAIQVKETEFEYDLDLDIDIHQFYLLVHQKALDYLDNKEFDKAEEYFLIADELKPSSPIVHYNLACVYSLSNRLDDAYAALRNAVMFGYNDVNHILRDPDLFPLHNHLCFQSLVECLKI